MLILEQYIQNTFYLDVWTLRRWCECHESPHLTYRRSYIRETHLLKETYVSNTSAADATGVLSTKSS